jgi:hypothetical protein
MTLEIENKNEKRKKTIIFGLLALILILLFIILTKTQIVKNLRVSLANILNPYKSDLEFRINNHSYDFETEDNDLEIKWQGSNVILCVASSSPELEEWTGEKEVKGEESLSINTSTTFSLTCAGPSGLISKEITVKLISKKAELKPIFKKIEFQKVEEKKKESKKEETKTKIKLTTSKPKTLARKTINRNQIVVQPSLIFKINNSDKEINVKPDENIAINWEAKNVNKCVAFSQPINPEWNNFINLKGSKTIGKLNQDTVFGIFCTYDQGYITKSIKVNVYIPNPLKVEIKVNDQAERVFVFYNSGITLSWNAENAEKCEAFSSPEFENWKGEIPLSGKRSILNITKDAKFGIKCSNKYQTVEKYVEVKIIFGGGGGGGVVSSVSSGVTSDGGGAGGGSATTPSLSVNLKVNNQEGPINANIGDSITLSWQSINAEKCTVSASPYYQEWSGFKEPQGSMNITLTKTGTTTFSISCVDKDGNDAVDQVIVYVKEQTLNKFVDIKVNGLDNVKVAQGANVNVRWDSNGMNTCTVSASPYLQEWSGLKPVRGETTLGPINQKTTLSISCLDELGNDFSDQAIIDIE